AQRLRGRPPPAEQRRAARRAPQGGARSPGSHGAPRVALVPPRGGTSKASPRAGKLVAKKGKGSPEGIFADRAGGVHGTTERRGRCNPMLIANDEGLRAGIEELDADIDDRIHERKDRHAEQAAGRVPHLHAQKEGEGRAGEIEEFAQEQLLGDPSPDTNREKVLDDLVKNMEPDPVPARRRWLNVGQSLLQHWPRRCS
ncbi:unnamed protein product, partial [Prorocentrum cordatum]